MKFNALKSVETRINKNYKCIKELEHFVFLQDSDEEKLETLSLIGKMYAEYITGVYSSNTLEYQIMNIGKKIEFFPTNKVTNRQILIVMSACAAVGGHTVLVHNWIKWNYETSYSIAFTNMDDYETPDFIKNVVRDSGGNLFYLSGSYMEKATELLKVSEKFQKILLFTHMEDIIPVLAYGNKYWKIPVCFYNHADFRFSYGFSVSDIILNLCQFDVDKTIRYRGIDQEDSIHFQFPGNGQMDNKKEGLDKVDIHKKVKEKYKLRNDEKLIVSMGSDFKFDSIIGYDFSFFIEELLRQYKGMCSFLIIGADQDKDKWIQLNKRTLGKAKALGVLPRNEAEQIISAADLYIVSFPMAAAGQEDAEKSDVPWLGLDIYGRGVRKDDIRFSNSIEELIEKSLEILNGNGNKYLTVQNADVWTKREWKEQWKKVCDSIAHHKVRSFYPQRHIEKQEYVNCQLMQEEGAKAVCDYINRENISPKLREELFRLDRKYDMGILYKYASYLDKKCRNLEEICTELRRFSESQSQFSNKHLQLYLTALKWIEVKQKGKRIDEYLRKQGYQIVAIYGMSYMGKCLLNDLEDDYVYVAYGIDKNAEHLHCGIIMHTPSENLKKVDLIINTTMIDNAEILKSMKTNNMKMIRLDKILNELG